VADADVVNHHNLNRYLYAVEADAASHAKKVDVLSKLLSRQTGLRIRACDLPFMEFKSRFPDWPRDLVVSTVDTAEARQVIQWEIPRVVLDAAVNQSVFYLHRVQLGRSACLKCTHGSGVEQSDVVESLSNALGIHAEEIRKMYFGNLPLAGDMAARFKMAAARKGLPTPEEGMTLRDWVMLHCGQLELKGAADLVLPIPFAVVLPGVLLAGEIIKERHFPDYALRDRVNHDVFGDAAGWLLTLFKPKPDCPLCGDATVKAAYRRRYAG
jgi:hypothetical protein